MTLAKRKKVILVSLDAFSSTDFDEAVQLPNFHRLVAQGAHCPRELSVYPSLTFPAHASISTGCKPAGHGITGNYLLAPFSELKLWNFYVDNLRRRALWDYAADGGKTVLSMSWPVSAGANIRYSMPEMTPAKPKVWNAANFFAQLGVFWRYGTPSFAIRSLMSRRKLPHAWFFGTQPVLDEEMIEAFLAAIDRYEFDIALLHIYGMDDAKHLHGANSPEAKAYLPLYDRFVGQLLDYSQRHSDEDVTVMITGDHSQKDVTKVLYGNQLLQTLGLCSFADGKLSEYQAYFESGDGMAYIRIREPYNTPETVEAIHTAFTKNPAVRKVMRPDEFAELGCDPTAALVIEAKDGYGFVGAICPDSMDHNCIGVSHDCGLHGYLPDAPDYQTVFFCAGPSVRHCTIPEMCITDITPTICHWLELPTDPMDGRPVTSIFREEVR